MEQCTSRRSGSENGKKAMSVRKSASDIKFDDCITIIFPIKFEMI